MIKQVLFFSVYMVVAAQTLAQDAASSIVEIIVPDGQKLSIGVDEIQAVNVDADKNSSQVTFQLDEKPRENFSALTTENLGKRLVVTVCGEEVLTATIQAPINGGIVLLSDLTEHKATEIAEVLLGNRVCA